MRETKWTCDRCGKEIQDNPVRIEAYTLCRENSDIDKTYRILGEEIVDEGFDLCKECTNKLMEEMSKWIQSVIGLDAVPAEDKPEKKIQKSTLDDGKIKALYETGWKIIEIAREMKVSDQCIINHLKDMGIYKTLKDRSEEKKKFKEVALEEWG